MENIDLEQCTENQLYSMLQDSEGEERLSLLNELLDRSENNSDYLKAASFAEQATSLAEKYLPNIDVENFYYRQGVNLWRLNDYEQAIAAFSVGVSKYAGEDDQSELAKNYWGLADSHFKLDNFDDSIKFAQLGTDAALANDGFETAGFNKFVQGKALYLADREQEAIDACIEARQYKRRVSNTAAVYDIDDYIATIYRYLGQYDEAEILLRNCLTLAEATTRNRSYANMRLGNVLIDQEKFDEARVHLETARSLYHEEDNLEMLADCDMSISRTYVGYSQVEEALKYARSATSLWDALGLTSSYIRGLERQSILLFTAERYLDAADMNDRIVAEIGESDSSHFLNLKGYAQLRKADDFVPLLMWDSVLETLNSTDQFGQTSTHAGNLWFYSLKARALYALNRHEEAMGIADSGLALTEDSIVNINTAYLYEIKARVSLEQNRPDKERHLAHAISLHLAFGEVDQARELSEYFKPNFTPQPKSGDVILTNERPSVVEETPND
jgi:tetratricopeptide (TPR) repeat protein